MLVVLFIVGLLIALGEILAARSNGRVAKAAPTGSGWHHVYRWRWLLGIALAIASPFVRYPVSSEDQRYDVLGFPFVVAAFDARGWDYIGPLTLPSLLANAVLWFFLPQLIVFAWRMASGAHRANS